MRPGPQEAPPRRGQPIPSPASGAALPRALVDLVAGRPGARVLRAFLGRQRATTRSEYERDLRSLGWALGLTDLELTAEAVCRDRGAHVEELAERWRAWLRMEGVSVATMRRRFGTLRGLIGAGIELGLLDPSTPLPVKRL